MKRIQLENRSDLKSEIPLETPYSIFIDPSSVCNFKCTFCMNSKIVKPEIMDFSVYKKIIDDLQEFDTPVKVIRLYGFGEPLINKKFIEMVEYAKKSDKVLSVDTTTNASLLTHKYNEKLIESGIDRINISIESLTDDGYKSFTGRDISFDSLVENIRHLNSIKGDTIIFIKIAGDYLSEDEKSFFFETFKPISSGCDIEHTANCWYDLDVENVNKDVGIYGQPLDDIEICPYIFYSFLIQPDGKISLCFLDWNKKMIIGDTGKQSVKDAWTSELFNKIRIDMLEGKKNNICQKCSQLKAGMPVNLDPYKSELLKRMGQNGTFSQ